MVRVLVLLYGVFIGFSSSQAQQIAKERCDKYNTILKTLDGSLLLLDFQESNIDENPHVVALGYIDDETTRNMTWLCGGNLISENYVLTVAHCLRTRLALIHSVRLGSKHLSSDGRGEVVEVEKTIPHPDYKPPSKYNDIGLIKLKRSVKFSKSILPACLNTIENLPAKPVNVGWGRADRRGDVLDTLWNSQMQYSTHEKCQKAYLTPRTLKSGVNFTQQFCAHKATEDAPPCFVISGCPMQVNEKGRLSTVVGVTSFGKGCDSEESPGVYGKVSAYVPWIESIVWINLEL